MKKNLPITIPNKLPLLEGLCWNIADPYKLTPSEMLGIYEERWHFLDVLGKLERSEIEFIKQIIRAYKGLPLLEHENVNKKEFFKYINNILPQLNTDLLIKHTACLGGGSLIGLKYQQLRYSNDIDFLINPKNYQQIKLAINSGEKVFLTEQNLIVGKPRIDRYGIRYPLTAITEDREIDLKLEIVAEYSLMITEPSRYLNIPCLNYEDRVVSKLIANADRWVDKSKFSRDLIDLAIIAQTEKELPPKAIAKANDIYSDAERCLKSAIEQFQTQTEYRQKCYERLQISQPDLIINGLDLLAKIFDLPLTKREFKEIDFGYLEEAPLPTETEREELEP